MGTRCNVILKSGDEKLIYRRHYDGYPESVIPDLRQFVDWIDKGLIRSDLSQCAGWLLMIGHNDYKGKKFTGQPRKGISGWKVSSYEPDTMLSGDIDYLYEVNVDNLQIHAYHGDMTPISQEDYPPPVTKTRKIYNKAKVK